MYWSDGLSRFSSYKTHQQTMHEYFLSLNLWTEHKLRESIMGNPEVILYLPAPRRWPLNGGDFRVAPGLCFKTRLNVKPLTWKWFFFILMLTKLFFTRKVLHLASFWTREFLNSEMAYKHIYLPIMFLPCLQKISSLIDHFHLRRIHQRSPIFPLYLR